LARDVQRYLNDEPVEACPPSPIYRMKKLARKHRGLLTAAASLIAVLVVASIVSTGLAAWAIRSRQETEAALIRERVARQEAIAAKEDADQAAQRLSTATQVANDGIEYYNRRNWSAAHEHFTRAMQIEPGLNTTYVYRGALYTQLGLWDLAAADYEQRFRLANRANARPGSIIFCSKHIRATRPVTARRVRKCCGSTAARLNYEVAIASSALAY
jgi:tetratricopeptide (TPR) repeat protein